VTILINYIAIDKWYIILPLWRRITITCNYTCQAMKQLCT